ncbi:MAG TPA: ABC transporter ATP-binding protein [Candidatus Saccharimonadales bacterium]|nr:ABC transporter ATP-binding protein [Candidatus Saccharimonadales bacterium]
MKNAVVPLKLTNLTKKYSISTAVENVSLQLEPGEVFGFLGPNGAGKSTTIRAILNFIRPTDGDISVFGLDSVRDSVPLKRHVGYLAGDIALYNDMTGKQLLTYLASLRKGADWDYIDDLQKRFNATFNRPIRTLSKGNVQKIGLIQAFMNRPDLIILDEPTSGLDPLMKQVFYDMVTEASARGSTIFISSHDLTEVQKICHRAAFIREGKLVAIEDLQTDENNLQLKRYVVRFDTMLSLDELQSINSVSAAEINGDEAVLTVTGEVSSFIKSLARYNVTDFESQDITLEDLFMHYYTETSDE